MPVHGILFGVCEKSFGIACQSMVKKNKLCAVKLHDLVRKNCNGSTVVVVEDVIGNLIEALFNFALIRGEEYEHFPKCLQAQEYKFEVLSGGGFDVAGTKSSDLHMNELISREQKNSLACK